jgi:hypothetical protein
MRTLTDHIVEGKCHNLHVEVLDEPGDGGACHEYRISGYSDTEYTNLSFQNGPINEDGVGVNGLQQEALLAVVIDRLRGFNEGPFRSRENSLALTKCEEALMWLQKRTRDRMARGVEGTHAK